MACMLAVAVPSARTHPHHRDRKTAPQDTSSHVSIIMLPGDSTSHQLVVFVHGLNGDALGTWVEHHKRDSTYLPSVLNADHAFDGVDFGVVQYPLTRRATVESIARQLADSLAQPRFRRYNQICFVAHSQGALIVAQLIGTTSSDSARIDRIKGAIFLAPVFESKLVATIVGYISGQPQLRYLGRTGGDRDVITRGFLIAKGARPPWPGDAGLLFAAASERRRIWWNLTPVCNRREAIAYDSGNPEVLDRDHWGMTKTRDSDSKVYGFVSGAILRVLRSPPSKKPTSSKQYSDTWRPPAIPQRPRGAVPGVRPVVELERPMLIASSRVLEANADDVRGSPNTTPNPHYAWKAGAEYSWPFIPGTMASVGGASGAGYERVTITVQPYSGDRVQQDLNLWFTATRVEVGLQANPTDSLYVHVFGRFAPVLSLLRVSYGYERFHVNGDFDYRASPSPHGGRYFWRAGLAYPDAASRQWRVALDYVYTTSGQVDPGVPDRSLRLSYGTRLPAINALRLSVQLPTLWSP